MRDAHGVADNQQNEKQRAFADDYFRAYSFKN